MHSSYDWSKHLVFGLGVGLGIGILLCRYYREKAKQEQQLTDSVEKLSAELRLLKETLVLVRKASLHDVEAVKKNNEDTIYRRYSDDEEEFFDSVTSPNYDSLVFNKDQSQEREKLEDNLSEILQKTETLRSDSDEDRQESFNILLKLSKEHPENCEVLWRLARAQYDMAMLSGKKGDQDKKLFYMKQGMQTGSKSLEIDDTSALAHKWYGILLGNYCEFCGNQEKIELGYQYKKHIERAIELNPADPSAYSLLARWCYEVYMLPWYMRKVAAAIFADPPTSTVEEALRYAMKAEELQPNFWKENSLLIGKCYYQKSDYQNAKKWLEKAKQFPTKSEDDRLAHEEIEQLLMKI